MNQFRDYAFYFSDSSYNKAYFLDHQTGKKTGYIFNDGEVLHSNNINNPLFIAKLFDNFQKGKQHFSFDFKNGKGDSKNVIIHF
ncbi:hypothetical protein [Flammeovirga sp. SJP92]|uniref:hypothetical protein n=1 Tax=Flammeovirga sp. SJP92 TaxID=1775430 RepID=UPI0007871E41|nr:hypothetical protein [Flammeovirga sp. SJP92]KXX72024.1 hypothetical protein AVL50_04380 [Flammeovirga sp. SJP92]